MAAINQSNAQNITPFLWFDGRVEEAINFYTSIFPDSEVINMNRLPGEVPGRVGKVMTGSFRLNGSEFMILDGGPMFTASPAISFFVKCETQQDVDHYWEKLPADGGSTSQCGWLTDKFGITWQIVPNALGELMYKTDPAKAQNVMKAMMKMTKLEIAALKKAYDEA